MSNEPKVSGLSPMTGPPGTKITVRGENLGQSSKDIIRLTINGADCLPYLEWMSSKKIITRCTKALGSGDIVITTNSGGVGTCDVQFNCYEEIVGLIDESAVWVEEVESKDQQQSMKQEDIESTGSISASSINDICSAELASSRFDPKQYLLQEYANLNLDELEDLRKRLEVELSVQRDDSDPTRTKGNADELNRLKSNLPVIMEFLSLIENLSKTIATSRDTSVDSIIQSIDQSRNKINQLFGPLLKRKDLCQEIEGAMHVFRQNENLFNLPSAIDNSIKTKNYDSVVKEISSVLTRLDTINIDQRMVKKIKEDVTTKVTKLRETIEEQLHQSCKNTTGERNVDEVKKLISHLNRLGQPINYDVWIALTEMSKALLETSTARYEHYLALSLNASKNSPSKIPGKIEQPFVVQFVSSAMNLFHNTYYDILSLGQSYFDPKDEFACKESEDFRQARLVEFEEQMISRPIFHLCNLLRYALVPDSSKLDKPSQWPINETESYVDYLRQVLQSVITCHIHLTKVNLPSAARAALEDFKEFVFELRVKSMQLLFSNATKTNRNLHDQENWIIEVDDRHGGTTQLPLIFEKNVIETLRFANDTIFKTSLSEEKSILKRVDVQASMKELALALINSFIDSLDNALIDSVEHPAESARLLIACRESNKIPSKYMNRLLITICNCQYTEDVIFPRLQDEFEKLQGLKMDRVIQVCRRKYNDYIAKISEKFCRIKCEELAKSQKIYRQQVNNNFENLQINLMLVNSQVFLVAPQLVNNLMTSIVNTMQKDSISVQKL